MASTCTKNGLSLSSTRNKMFKAFVLNKDGNINAEYGTGKCRYIVVTEMKTILNTDNCMRTLLQPIAMLYSQGHSSYCKDYKCRTELTEYPATR